MNPRALLRRIAGAITGIALVAFSLGAIAIPASAQPTPQIQPNPDPWSKISPQPGGKTAVIYISGDISAFETATSVPRIEFERMWLESQGYNVEMRHGTVESIAEGMADPIVKAFSYFGHGSGATIESLDAKGWQVQLENFLLKKYRAAGMSRDQALAQIKSLKIDKELVRNVSCYSLSDTSLAKKLVKPGGSYWGSADPVVNCPTPSQLWTGADLLLTEYKVPAGQDIRLSGTASLYDGSYENSPYTGPVELTVAEGNVEGTFTVTLKDNRRKATFRGTLDADGKLTARLDGDAEPADPPAPPPKSGVLDGPSNAISAMQNLIIRPMRTFKFTGELTGTIRDGKGSGHFTASGERKPGGPITLTGTWSGTGR